MEQFLSIGLDFGDLFSLSDFFFLSTGKIVSRSEGQINSNPGWARFPADLTPDPASRADLGDFLFLSENLLPVGNLFSLSETFFLSTGKNRHLGSPTTPFGEPDHSIQEARPLHSGSNILRF